MERRQADDENLQALFHELTKTDLAPNSAPATASRLDRTAFIFKAIIGYAFPVPGKNNDAAGASSSMTMGTQPRPAQNPFLVAAPRGEALSSSR